MSTTAPELRLVQSVHDENPDPLIGQTLDGRYVVERVLGQGGMGLVYRARHVVLNKALAIKVLKPEVSRDEQVIARFRREAQSASGVGSPHICDVSDFGTLPDGSTYFVMEYLDGPSLTTAMERERPMAIDRAVRIGIQLCDALGAAHERGIVHRDLKPDNVHIVRQGNRENFVKVLDFGIAKVGNAADKKLTQAGQVFGTPHYMSPEQCSGREVDHRTDIYALGVMLYEMVCGQVPFDADNLMGVLTKHVYEQPIPPRSLPPPVNVPPGMEAVILKSLAKQAEQRYQTMGELRTDLELVIHGATPQAVMHSLDSASMIGYGSYTSEGGYHPAMQVAVAAPPHEEPKSRAVLLVLALFALLFVGGGVFAVAFFVIAGSSDPPPRVHHERPQPPVATPPVVTPTPPAPVETGPATGAVVHLATDPQGAEVYSGDGSLLGNTPVDLPRPERGESTNVTLRMPGFTDRTFTVSNLTSNQVTVRLEHARVATSSTRQRTNPRQITARQIAPPTPVPLAPQNPRPVTTTRRESEIINPF